MTHRISHFLTNRGPGGEDLGLGALSAFTVLLALAVACVAVFLMPQAAYGYQATSIPDSVSPLDRNGAFTLDLSTLDVDSVEWGAATGRSFYREETGAMYFCLPVQSTTSETVYDTPLSLWFRDVARIGDRSIDAHMTFLSVTFGKAYSTVTGLSNAQGDPVGKGEVAYGCFLSVWPEDMPPNVGSSRFWFYRGLNSADVRIQYVWSDTGAPVDVLFFQLISDIDIALDSAGEHTEYFEAISGYQPDYFLYANTNDLVISQGQGSWGETIRFNARVVANGQTQDRDGEDSVRVCGVYMIHGSDTVASYAWGRSSMMITEYSQYDLVNPAEKSVVGDGRYGAGETVSWQIRQPLGTFYHDTFNYYSNLVITDVIPEGVEYLRAQVCDEKGIAYGPDEVSISYDEGTRTLTCQVDASLLRSVDFYDGGELVIGLDCLVGVPAYNETVVTNRVLSTISGIEYPSNDSEILLMRPAVTIGLQAQSPVTAGQQGLVVATVAPDETRNLACQDVQVQITIPEGFTPDVDAVQVRDYEGKAVQDAQVSYDPGVLSVTVPQLSSGQTLEIEILGTVDVSCGDSTLPFSAQAVCAQGDGDEDADDMEVEGARFDLDVQVSIAARDIYASHGEVSIPVRLTGTAWGGNPVIRFGLARFDMGKNPDDQGNLTAVVTFEQVPAGTYEAATVKSIRYGTNQTQFDLVGPYDVALFCPKNNQSGCSAAVSALARDVDSSGQVESGSGGVN
ncbi:MAG: hypothetical protein PUD02_08615 [Eggerthellales bacterium]|nr:hypothetical protein [Eggerthellales bacterium]